MEVGRSAEQRADGSWQRLYDLAVALLLKLPHPITVEKVNAAFLTGSHQQMRVRFAACHIRQQHHSARPQVDIRIVQTLLVERCEKVRDL